VREAAIVSAARTPIGKAFKGAFNQTHGAVLTGHALRHAAERAKLDFGEIDDVVIGCGLPEGATGHNLARNAALRAGFPVSVSGTTINRYCASGLQAISTAAHRVIVDGAPVVLAGGCESISRVQNEMNLKGFT
jgi:acetyl-CoA C-acetyltransferase